MAAAKSPLGDYVEVKDRIRLFYEKHPDGRLATTDVRMTSEPDGIPRVVVEAAAYRSPEDPLPGRGWSWMQLPGGTNFTRGSELENTETSAWGRAIGALGIGIDKSIASSNEIQNKAGEDYRPPAVPPGRTAPARSSSAGGGTSSGMWEGSYLTTATADGMARAEAKRGHVLKFVLTDPDPYPGFRRINVRAYGDLAAALGQALAVEAPEHVTVWGELHEEVFTKDGKDITYAVCEAERVSTPDWTLPGDTVAPAPGQTDTGLTDDLSELPW